MAIARLRERAPSCHTTIKLTEIKQVRRPANGSPHLFYLLGWSVWLATWFPIGKGTNWVSELSSAWQFGVLPFWLVHSGKAIVASGLTVSGRALVAWFMSLGGFGLSISNGQKTL